MPLNQTWNQGFLGTAAPRYADLVLLLEIAMGLALLAGALLARLRKFRAHAFCQSAIVLLNAVIIALVMRASFRVHVASKIPQS
jgi:Ca2+/H+ antiporter